GGGTESTGEFRFSPSAEGPNGARRVRVVFRTGRCRAADRLGGAVPRRARRVERGAGPADEGVLQVPAARGRRAPRPRPARQGVGLGRGAGDLPRGGPG